MKKTILWLLIGIFIISFGYARQVKVCVIAQDAADPNDLTKSNCFNVEENTDGYSVLQQSGFAMTWSANGTYGHALCQVEGKGDSVSGAFCAWGTNFWNFALASNNNDFKHMSVGFDAPGGCWNGDFSSWGGHYCAKDGDIIGLGYGPAGSVPKMLFIDSIKATVDGKKDSDVDETGGNINKDLEPGSKVKMTIKLENLYDKDDAELTIENIAVIATIDGIDDGDDLEEEADEFDLDAEDKETVTLEFNIPYAVDEQEYDMKLEIEGEDEKGINHKHTIDYQVSVDKKSHQLIFTEASLIPEELLCDKTTQLKFVIANIGSDDEDVDLQISAVGFNFAKTDSFQLDEGEDMDDISEKISLPITIPDNLKPGTYNINIKADYNNGKDTEQKQLQLTVKDCKITPEEKEEVTLKNETKQDVIIQYTKPPITGEVTTLTTKEPKASNMTILIIAVEVVLILIVLIAIIALLFRKKQ